MTNRHSVFSAPAYDTPYSSTKHQEGRRAAIKACLGLVAGPATVWPLTANADAFPGSQPIRIVVPFAPGGSTDVIARLLAIGMSKDLDGNVIVENIQGATGTVGAARVARAAPDGHTLLLGVSATQAIAPALMKGLSYKPEDDFVAVGRVVQSGILIAAHPNFEANTVSDLTKLARKAPAPLIYGTWGNGSAGHLMMESIALSANAKMEQVAYKGETPLLQALLGGEVKLGAAGASSVALQHVRAGKLKVLGISGQQRWSLLPDVPLLSEQGIPFKPSSWYGLFAPARTPAPILIRLTQSLEKVLALPQTAEGIRSLGMDIGTPISRRAFEQQVRDDTLTWTRMIEVSGAKAD